MTAIKPKSVIQIVVPGPPVAWSRPMQKGPRRVQTNANRSWVGTAVPLMSDALFSHGYVAPLEGPLRILVRAYFALPKTMYLKRQPRTYQWHTKTPDASNILKLVEDAANGVLYQDDRQIVRAVCEKRICPQEQNRPRVEIFLARMTEDPTP